MLVAFVIFEAVCLAALLLLVFSERHVWRRKPEIRQLPPPPQSGTVAVAEEDERRQAA